MPDQPVTVLVDALVNLESSDERACGKLHPPIVTPSGTRSAPAIGAGSVTRRDSARYAWQPEKMAGAEAQRLCEGGTGLRQTKSPGRR
jgi:hypothetical protein